jgi:hypothetical protein
VCRSTLGLLDALLVAVMRRRRRGCSQHAVERVSWKRRSAFAPLKVSEQQRNDVE